jgi:hypothetical protein
MDLRLMGRNAMTAARVRVAPDEVRNAALLDMACRLDAVDDDLWQANQAISPRRRAAGSPPLCSTALH